MSFERVNSQEIGQCCFFEAFYKRFIDAAEEVAEKFKHTDMEQQQKMLKRSFYSLLTFYASYQADHCLEQIAVKHNRFNLDIQPELYDLWLEILIDTVKDFDPEFSNQIELVWRLVMAPGITYMKFHYDKEVL